MQVRGIANTMIFARGICKNCFEGSRTGIPGKHARLRRSTPPRKNSSNNCLPLPLWPGVCETKSKMCAPDPENLLFLVFSVLRGELRPWSRKGPDHGVGVDPEILKIATSRFARGIYKNCLEGSCTGIPGKHSH